MANSNATKEALKCTASIAADSDSIVDAINFITGVLFCDQKTSFSQIRLRLRPNLNSEIRPNSASAEFEKVKFGATLLYVVGHSMWWVTLRGGSLYEVGHSMWWVTLRGGSLYVVGHSMRWVMEDEVRKCSNACALDTDFAIFSAIQDHI